MDVVERDISRESSLIKPRAPRRPPQEMVHTAPRVPAAKKVQSPGGVFKLSQGPAPLNKRKRVVKAHWTVPLITGLRPKMALTIGDRTFRFLIDTGANHTIIRKDKPPLLLGVGRQSTSWETRLPWTDPDGNRWEVHSLVVSGLTVNVLGQDIRRETDA